MPKFALVRGFGEGYYATGYIIRIVKALNRRFRSKITFDEIPLGDYLSFNTTLDKEMISKLRQYDVIYIGDFETEVNKLHYTIDDLVMAMSNNLEYLCVSGVGKYANVDIEIASYFDGGFNLRDGEQNTDGCTETRICSTYTATDIVKNVSRECEQRRRRIAFVKDNDNSYCADLFFNRFEDFTLPLSNFRVIKYSVPDIVYELINTPFEFDVIFSSKSFSDAACGLCKTVLEDDFVCYRKFGSLKLVYAPKSVCNNAGSPNIIPSILSYISALSRMLKDEFVMEKEAYALNVALNDVTEEKISLYDMETFINKFIESLEKPINIKNTKKNTLRYIN